MPRICGHAGLVRSAATRARVAKPAFHRGACDPFPLPQAAAADAVEVLLANAAAERFGGPHARQDARKALPETAFAARAEPLPRLQFQLALPHAPAFVPRPANPPVLHSQFGAAAMRTQNRPRVNRARMQTLPAHFFNACNLDIQASPIPPLI